MAQSSLDQSTVDGISRLSFASRRVVEGLRSGHHRSPFFGSSVEFAEHKEYAPGDDLRYIDWKLFGKADRYYIKRFEEETNLVAWLLIDQSASMTYAGTGLGSSSKPWWKRVTKSASQTQQSSAVVGPYGQHVPAGSKLAWSTLLATSLAHLLIQQGDSVGLITFGGGAPTVVAPRSQPGHLQALMRAMVAAPKPGYADLPQALADFTPRLKQRGVVVLVSDLLEEPTRVFEALKALRPHRNDVVCLQVLDPDELTFPFTDVAKFQDPEDTKQNLLADPQEIRAAYLEEFKVFLEDVRLKALDARVDYALMDTGDAVGSRLSGWIAQRWKRAQSGGRRP